MADEPVLLAGGNPQIPMGDGRAPVEAYLDAMPGWKRATGRRLDQLIVGTVPGVHTFVRYNSPFYAVRDDWASWFVGFHCLTTYVKVSFQLGSRLDPVPAVSSTVGDTRSWHVSEHDLIDDGVFTSWVRQAVALG